MSNISTYDSYDYGSSAENTTALDYGFNITTDSNKGIVGTRVRGGQNVRPGEFPHQIFLTADLPSGDGYSSCGGSIIHPLLILTAAHCIYGFNIRGLKVTTGEHQRSARDGTEQYHSVRSAIMHERYNRQTADNDIAILRLENPITMDKFRQAIKLPQPNQLLPAEAYVSGWGRTGSFSFFQSPAADVLQKAKIQFVEKQTCRAIARSRGTSLTENMICAGDSAKSSCKGDSGGPLTCEGYGEKFLCGIVSWGWVLCGQQFNSDLPGVYVDVRRYHDWIGKQMQMLVPDSTTTPSVPTSTSAPPPMPSPPSTSSPRVTNKRCKVGRFQCKMSGACIPENFKCDGSADCGYMDNSDEYNCKRKSCPRGGFRCKKTRRCIKSSDVCDGYNDCGDNDNSDELNCGGDSSDEYSGNNWDTESGRVADAFLERVRAIPGRSSRY